LRKPRKSNYRLANYASREHGEERGKKTKTRLVRGKNTTVSQRKGKSVKGRKMKNNTSSSLISKKKKGDEETIRRNSTPKGTSMKSVMKEHYTYSSLRGSRKKPSREPNARKDLPKIGGPSNSSRCLRLSWESHKWKEVKGEGPRMNVPNRSSRLRLKRSGQKRVTKT